MKQNKKSLLRQEVVGSEGRECAPVMLDIAGTSLSDDDCRRLAHPLTGGVILFRRNWQNRAQLCALTSAIKALRPDILIAVDHEGGRVQRFQDDGFTIIPPMRALGQQWLKDDLRRPGMGPLAALESATACGYVMAAELRACGVDLSFTPVLDLDWGRSSVIGDRAFSHDPRVVSLLARALMQGLKLSGMSNCGKHYPGHGFVEADSHVSEPVDERSFAQILTDDLLPYQTLGIALDAVMTAHVVYPEVDSQVASFSERWLKQILRGDLGFLGCVFSDDLGMEGARAQAGGKPMGFTQAALAALQAGCDMVLLCNQSTLANGEAVDELLGGLTAAHKKGRWAPAPISEYRRRQLLPQACALSWDALMEDPRYIEAREVIADL